MQFDMAAIISDYIQQDREAEKLAKRQAAAEVYSVAVVTSQEIAEHLDVSQADVFEEMAHMPDAMLSLLFSPNGITAIAEYVAAHMGLEAPTFLPAMH